MTFGQNLKEEREASRYLRKSNPDTENKKLQKSVLSEWLVHLRNSKKASVTGKGVGAGECERRWGLGGSIRL